jgi:hypothetical protein
MSEPKLTSEAIVGNGNIDTTGHQYGSCPKDRAAVLGQRARIPTCLGYVLLREDETRKFPRTRGSDGHGGLWTGVHEQLRAYYAINANRAG